jgi:hypothetical protein
MIMRIEASIHRDDGARRTPMWKHANEYKERIMDEIERLVWLAIESPISQHGDAFLSELRTPVDFVVLVPFGIHVCNWTFTRLGVC